MEREKFRTNFSLAVAALLPFTQSFLIDKLPEQVRFLVFLNQSYDKNELVDDEELFLEESLPENNVKEFENEVEVTGLLWRNEKVPEWINLTVHSFDENFTYISLTCCGRFTANDKLLYHKQEGYQPFHALGPNLPVGFESIEKSGKFDLNWHGRIPNKNEPYF